MLVVCFNHGHDVTWHVGDESYIDTFYRVTAEETADEVTTGKLLATELAKVYMIQADGDELEHIKKMFSGNEWHGYTIPLPDKRVVRWVGDLARTILVNL